MKIERNRKKIGIRLVTALIVLIAMSITSSAHECYNTQVGDLHWFTVDTTHFETNCNYDTARGDYQMTEHPDNETQTENSLDYTHDYGLTTNIQDKHTENISGINGNHNNINIYVNNIFNTPTHGLHEISKHHKTTTTHTIHTNHKITNISHVLTKISNLLQSFTHIFDFIKYIIRYLKP